MLWEQVFCVTIFSMMIGNINQFIDNMKGDL
jgi:hypothetical protein